MRCAIYTRKSTEEGLEQEFSSLDHQRESLRFPPRLLHLESYDEICRSFCLLDCVLQDLNRRQGSSHDSFLLWFNRKPIRFTRN